MKYNHKCPVCNREATVKYKNVYFCDTHCKGARRIKAKVVYKEKLIFSIPNSKSGIYAYEPVKLK